MSELAAIFRRRVRQLLAERDWAGRKLAREAKIDPSTLNRIMNGEREPNFDTVERVARGFGVPPLSLLLEGNAPAVAPLAPASGLTDRESELLEAYRDMDPDSQGFVRGLAVSKAAEARRQKPTSDFREEGEGEGEVLPDDPPWTASGAK